MSEENRMNQEIKAQWVAALRSGEYWQTTGALGRVGAGYCCLGVLTDLAVKAGVVEWVVREKYGAARLSVEEQWTTLDGQPFCHNEDSVLAGEVQKWAGLSKEDPRVFYGGHSNLSQINDQGKGFETIADLIEEQL